MGRVRKYKDIKALEAKIDSYFKSTDTPTVAGLTLYLGFVDRHSLMEYAQTPKYAATIKKARTTIENALETRLYQGKPPIGLIFGLKNNFGWQDKHDLDLTSNGETLGIVELPARKA